MLVTLDFYLRACTEVISLINKIQRCKLKDESLHDDKLAILWGVYSREPTLAVLNGVLDPSVMPQNTDYTEKLQNNAWKLISKLAKGRLIHREHLVAYWPKAVEQIN